MKLSDVKFSDLELPEQLLKGVTASGFEYLAEVQALSLPTSLSGKDVAVQAQTGSGKTAAFLITIFEKLLRTEPPKGVRGVCPRAIVITPTRELAVQVAKDAEEIVKGGDLPIRILLAYGGVDYQKQREEISQGVDLLVGTPGRLIDYLKQRVYNLRHVEMAVIDEADRMFDMGFVSDIRFLLRRMSPYNERQSMLFSATLSERVMELSYEYMNIPELVEVTPDNLVADKVEQTLYHLGSNEKMNYMLGFLEKEEWTKALVFVNTKRAAIKVRDTLNANGHPTVLLSGDVTQVNRLKVIKRFSSGDVKVLVATDVASRGLHIENISHVINYDVPQDPQDYVHRIGRTARAGKSGKAITLACEDYVFTLPEIEEYIGHSIPVGELNSDYFIDFKKPPRRPRAIKKISGSRGRGPSGRSGDKRAGNSSNKSGERRGGGGSSRRRRGGSNSSGGGNK